MLIENALNDKEKVSQAAEKEILNQSNPQKTAEKLSFTILRLSGEKRRKALDLLRKIIHSGKVNTHDLIINNLIACLRDENDFMTSASTVDILEVIEEESAPYALIMKLEKSHADKSMGRYILSALTSMKISAEEVSAIVEIMKKEDDLNTLFEFIAVLSKNTDSIQKQKLYPIIHKRMLVAAEKKSCVENDDISINTRKSFINMDELKKELPFGIEYSVTYYPSPEEYVSISEKYNGCRFLLMPSKNVNSDLSLVIYNDDPSKDIFIIDADEVKNILTLLGMLNGKGMLFLSRNKGKKSAFSCPVMMTEFARTLHTHPEKSSPSEGDRDTWKKIYK